MSTDTNNYNPIYNNSKTIGLEIEMALQISHELLSKIGVKYNCSVECSEEGDITNQMFNSLLNIQDNLKKLSVFLEKL